MREFITSDLHMGHANAIRYCNRPMLNKATDLDENGNWISEYIAKLRLEEMDNLIIRKWNERVKPEDIVYVIGDFCFKSSPQKEHRGEGVNKDYLYYDRQLNGKKIYIRGNHDCFSKDTRLLTLEGYKYYQELKLGDLIPTVNLDKKIIEYNPIKNIIINNVNKSYYFKTSHTEGNFSSNHKLLQIGSNQKISSTGKFSLISAEKLWNYKSSLILPSSFVSGNKDYEKFSDNELKLLAWIYTDGSIATSKSSEQYKAIVIYQSKPKGIEIIKTLLNDLKIKYKEHSRQRKEKLFIKGKEVKSRLPEYTYYINSKQSRIILNKLEINSKYEIPNWLCYLSDRQIKILLEEMNKGNGSMNGRKCLSISGKKDFLDKILGLCVTHGLDSNMVKNKRGDWYLCVHGERQGSICGVKYISKNKREIKEYNDIMWCVNVDNHIIFTELNGKPLITGNSHNSCKTSIISLNMYLGGLRLHLVHNPSFIRYDCDLNLVGHVHNLWKIKRDFFGKGYVDMYNVGVDVNNFMPLTIEDIISNWQKWKKKEGFK